MLTWFNHFLKTCELVNNSMGTQNTAGPILLMLVTGKVWVTHITPFFGLWHLCGNVIFMLGSPVKKYNTVDGLSSWLMWQVGGFAYANFNACAFIFYRHIFDTMWKTTASQLVVFKEINVLLMRRLIAISNTVSREVLNIFKVFKCSMLLSSRALQQVLSLPHWTLQYQNHAEIRDNLLLTSFPKKFLILLCIPVGVVVPPATAGSLLPPPFKLRLVFVFSKIHHLVFCYPFMKTKHHLV